MQTQSRLKSMHSYLHFTHAAAFEISIENNKI